MLDWAIKYFWGVYQADCGYITAYENIEVVLSPFGDDSHRVSDI